MMDKFQYTKLPSEDYIRIIQLLPGPAEEILQCSLSIELRSHSEGTYDAMSYVWEIDKHDEVVCCERKLQVTSNLANALRRIRSKNPGKPTRLWADAISINQNDPEEKGHQVKRMGSVYENARLVHIWLGPDENKVAQNIFNTTEAWIELLHEYAEPSKVPHTIASSQLCKDTNRGSNFAKLMARPWFSRVWVVQEVALAKTARMHWGDATLDFADLVELACFYDGSSNIASLIGGHNEALRFLRILFRCVYRTYGKTELWGSQKPYFFKRLSRKHSPDSGLFLDILLIGKSLNATEVRDHIFSFCGNPLALGDDGNMLVKPDYCKPESQINLELTNALLQSRRERPYVLSFVQHASAKEVTATCGPSWTPRWSHNGQGRKPNFTIGNLGLGYMAAGMLEDLGAGSHYRITNEQVLVLDGFIYDKLCWTSDLLESGMFAIDAALLKNSNKHVQGLSYVEGLWKEASLAFGRYLGSTKPLDEARYERDFSYTLVTGYNGSRNISFKEHRRIFRAYRRALERKRNVGQTHNECNVSMNQDRDAGKFESQVYNCDRRRIGISEHGRFILVPEFAQEGDVCALLLGMATPFLLRPASVQEHGEGYHHLVGEAYAHGVMRGELLEDFNNGKIQVMLI